MEYHIYHMFPKLLNLYSDKGNITALSYFAKQMNLDVVVHEVNDISDIDWTNIDFMLLGGGSDREQAIVTNYLGAIKDRLKQEIDNGLPVLAVCGGYQFLGNYYLDSHGNKLEGLGILDFHTVGQLKQRLIGNTIIKSPVFGEIIGFVNHAGETFHDYQSLGQVQCGYGNNLTSDQEGIMYANLLGSYLHGPILPKNPALCLYYLRLFSERKKIEFDESIFDLSLENKTRQNLLHKYLKQSI